MQELNEKQEIAVKHLEGPMLVLAGAGSGKTRVVTARIAHLLSLGVPSSEILALTFTNKAAEEMRSRIQRMAHQWVLTSTFHSLGARILRESISILGYRRDFAIYDEKDSLQLLKMCLEGLRCQTQKESLKAIRIGISHAKNGLLSPSDPQLHGLGPQLHGLGPHALREVWELYQQKLKEYNALDFDDLLYLTVALFKESEETLRAYQERWRFFLIDEYQDTNEAQYSMIKQLAQRKGNIFVVGDPDQSIYSWRGANIANILNFERDYKEAQILTLEQNYRSTGTILAAANALIQNNHNRFEKKLWSALGPGEKLGRYIAENEKEEALFIVNTLLEKVKEQRLSLNECVIFYRTNAQSRIFEDVLLKNRIPYVIYGGISFYQRREIKDILSFLRMVVSDADYLAFERTIHLPKRGVGSVTLAKLRNQATATGLPILAFIRKVLEETSSSILLPKRAKAGLRDYLKVIDRLRLELHQGALLEDLVCKSIELSGYEQVLKEDPETLQERRENLNGLINKAAEWRQEGSALTLSQFLEELSLKSTLDEPFSGDTVSLMTLHNGKGLEFSLTFIVGMEEDLFPHMNAKDSVDAIEEERRLCYVGMTRAKQFLYLTASSWRLMWGLPKKMRPSRFLSEIPSEFFQSIAWEAEGVKNGEKFPIGSRVVHKDFGKGVIKKIYETSVGKTYDVEFVEQQATFSLVARFAHFTPASD